MWTFTGDGTIAALTAKVAAFDASKLTAPEQAQVVNFQAVATAALSRIIFPNGHNAVRLTSNGQADATITRMTVSWNTHHLDI